jgi:hypothetical protein
MQCEDKDTLHSEAEDSKVRCGNCRIRDDASTELRQPRTSGWFRSLRRTGQLTSRITKAESIFTKQNVYITRLIKLV